MTDRSGNNTRTVLALREPQPPNARPSATAGRATPSISFELAKAALIKEQEKVPPPTHEPRPISAVPEPAPLSSSSDEAMKPESRELFRAEQIKRDMEEWRRKNEDKDFGREM